MRLKKLLILCVSLFACVQLSAAEWVKPVLEVATLAAYTPGDTVYMYNKEAGGFYSPFKETGSPYWGTRAGIRTSDGAPVIIIKATESDYPDLATAAPGQDWSVWDEKTVIIHNYVPSRSRWDDLWFNILDSVTLWTDRKNDAANNVNFVFEIEAVGNGAYKFKASHKAPAYDDPDAVDHALGYIGVVPSRGNNELYFCGNILEETCATEWHFVSQEDYAKVDFETYSAEMNRYNAAMRLKAIIEKAQTECPGIDVAAQIAVYGNTSSTLEELEAAIEAVNAAIVAYNTGSASVDNPKDLSALITNPTFDTIGDFTGWEGTKFGAGGTTAACAEHYDKVFDTYQTLKGAPLGVYALKVNGFYRAGTTDVSYQNFKNNNPCIYDAKLYAVNGTDTLNSPISNNFKGILPNNPLGCGQETNVKDGDYTYYSPNSMADAVTYFNAGYYNDNVVYFASTDGTPIIGVAKNTHLSQDWSIFDSFSLTFYGNTPESYQFWMDKLTENLPDYSAEEHVTGAYLEVFNSTVEQYKVATTYEQVINNHKAIESAKDSVEANIAAWKAYVALAEKALEECGSGKLVGEDADNLGDYLDLDYQDIIAAHELTTPEIIAETAKLQKMYEDAVENCLLPGTDFTSKLVNPDYSQGTTGWSGTYTAVSNSCAESWNQSSFDMYQIVKGAPVGCYEISVQGFYRELRGANAWNAYFYEDGSAKDEVTSKAYIYLNDAQTPLRNVFEEGVPHVAEFYGTTDFYADPNEEYDYPNAMNSSAIAFGAGMYESSAFGLVAQKGDVMRIGVKGYTNTGNDSWAIWDNFRLTYQGFNAKIIKPVLQNKVDNFAVDGLMGSDVKAEAVEILAAAKEALKSNDGQVMFAALSDIYKFENKMKESIALFAKLVDQYTILLDVISVSEADEETKSAATLLWSEIDNALMAGTYTDADAKAKLEEIAAMIIKLKLPAGYQDATDENPVDFTGVISTPSFDKDGVNSVEGWTIVGTAAGYNFGNDDTQKSALALEFYEKGDYNMYQSFTGLPNGTYKVEMNAFFRMGANEADYASYQNKEKSHAMMYAKATENDSIENYVCLRASDPSLDQLGVGSEFQQEDGTFVPNDMVSAVAYFDEGHYHNGIYVKVVDGTLRFGVTQKSYISGDWMIMDNWTLTYYGTASKHAEGPISYGALLGDANSDGSVNVNDITTVAAFILNGTADNWNEVNADANCDGSINVNDITTIASIILNNAKLQNADIDF